MRIHDSTRALRLMSSRCIRAPSVLSRRSFSSKQETPPVHFSYGLSKLARDPIQHMFDDLTSTPILRNSHSHDTAVVLATPDFSRKVCDKGFMQSLADVLAGPGNSKDFNILCAIVDNIAPPLGSYTPISGISVLRGQMDDIMSPLWNTDTPLTNSNTDTVSSLTFGLGKGLLTLPLARTTFNNNKTSTLLASRFGFSQSSLQMEQQLEKRTHFVSLPVPLQDIHSLKLWAPLVPLTARRILSESFGNIIRAIDVDGKSIPASTELESVVNTLYSQGTTAKLTPGGAGVWALVTPPANVADLHSVAGPGSILESTQEVNELSPATSSYIERSFGAGGRLYKILSGGGGWGAKKGLLSLDPQISHFEYTEEEEMRRFMLSMENKGIVPPGSIIQFFMSTFDPPNMPEGSPPSFVFGVAGDQSSQTTTINDDEEESCFLGGHFGALSNDSIYIDSTKDGAQSEQFPEEMKLSVPNSRLYITSEGGGMSKLGSVAAGGVADAGFLGMLMSI